LNIAFPIQLTTLTMIAVDPEKKMPTIVFVGRKSAGQGHHQEVRESHAEIPALVGRIHGAYPQQEMRHAKPERAVRVCVLLRPFRPEEGCHAEMRRKDA
jgi:hypothetical protein